MARYRSGILGPISGKISNVVGASAFGINYLRELVIPSNPRTELQTFQRVKFGLLVRTLAQFLPLSIRSLFRRRAVGMSAWSRAVMVNTTPKGQPFEVAFLQVSEGETPPPVVDAIASLADDVTATISYAGDGGAADGDTIHMAAVNRLTGGLIGHSAAERDNGEIAILGIGDDFDSGLAVLLFWAVRHEGTADAEGSKTITNGRTAADPVRKQRADTSF